MFRYSRLILLFSASILFAACETTPVAPQPPAVVQHVVGYQISLVDSSNGKVTTVYRIPKENLISEDVLNRNLKFKTEEGQIVTYHGSWRKEVMN